MLVISNVVCFLLGVITCLVCKGKFTIEYNYTYRDKSKYPAVTEKNPIGYKTQTTETEKKDKDTDTAEEIAAKIQEAIGVFVDE